MIKIIFSFLLMLQFFMPEAQPSIGSISSASLSNSGAFAVGELYLEGQVNGNIGVYAYLIKNGLLSSLNDMDESDNYTIFPNPTEGSFEIRSGQKSITDIKVIDGFGRIIKVLSPQNIGDISDLPHGVYYLQLNNTKAFKIIKI